MPSENGTGGELQVDVYFDVVEVDVGWEVSRDGLCYLFRDEAVGLLLIGGLEDINGCCYPRIIHLSEQWRFDRSHRTTREQRVMELICSMDGNPGQDTSVMGP